MLLDFSTSHHGYYYTPRLEQITNTESVSGVQYSMCYVCSLSPVRRPCVAVFTAGCSIHANPSPV